MATRMTTKEAATILGVTQQRVIAMINEGKLKAEKFGNAWSVSDEALEAVKDRKIGRPRKGKNEDK